MLVLALLGGWRASTTHQGFWLGQGGNSALVPLRAPNLNLWSVVQTNHKFTVYNALSREVFVVNIFCEQPKLSTEEPNATRKIHETDLCLRLYAVANVRTD